MTPEPKKPSETFEGEGSSLHQAFVEATTPETIHDCGNHTETNMCEPYCRVCEKSETYDCLSYTPQKPEHALADVAVPITKALCKENAAVKASTL